MNFYTLTQKFIIIKQAEGLAPRTIQTHQTHLAAFTNWLPEEYIEQPHLIQIDTLRECINYCQNTHQRYATHPTHAKRNTHNFGLAPATINIRIRTLHAFFRWAEQEGHLQHNPAIKLKQLRIPEDIKESLIPTQIQAILAQPDPFTRQGRRDLALLLLLVDTGARITETLALRQDSVDLVNLQITFRGNTTKTRRTRLLPISKRTASALRTVLIIETENNNVFQARSGKQLSYKRWVALLHLYAKQAGVQATVTPHTLRHSFARNWIVQGGDPFSLQRMLGHSDMNMVRRYVQLYSQDLKEKHDKYSLIQ